MTDYGYFVSWHNDAGDLVVIHADRMVGMTREVFRQLRDRFPRDDGYVQLDTAGKYVYRFHRDDPSPQGFQQDVVVFTRVDPSELATKINLTDDSQADTYDRTREREEATLMAKIGPDPIWQALTNAGLAHEDTRRVVIDITHNGIPIIHTERYGDDRLLDVIAIAGKVRVVREERQPAPATKPGYCDCGHRAAQHGQYGFGCTHCSCSLLLEDLASRLGAHIPEPEEIEPARKAIEA